MLQTSERNSPDGSQLSAVRQRRLLEVVQARGAVSVRDLCDYLQVSDATIRRDIGVLDQKGLVSRTHGGVVANSIVRFDLPNTEREQINEAEKQRIGAIAIDLLKGNETVLIDAGTTALAMVDFVQRKPDCTYVTTSLGVSQRLREKGIERHYLIGGSYLAVNDSFCGSIAVSTIQTLSFDVALLCASAIDINRRAISISSEAYAQVQREIVKVSRKCILLADHTKFRASSFIQTARFDDIFKIITDKEIDPAIVRVFDDEELELRQV